jgi:hypothetical protein
MLAAFLIMGNIFLHRIKCLKSLEKNGWNRSESFWKGSLIRYFVMLNKEKAWNLSVEVRKLTRPGLTRLSDGCVERSSNVLFVALGENWMTSKTATLFKKTAACPSSSTLVSFRSKKLPAEMLILVRCHLKECEFCGSELSLLAHARLPLRVNQKTPEIPMNLRILAESILCKNRG